MCGRGQKPTPASDDANKRDSCRRREGREEERAMERRKERDAPVKKMNQSERIKTHVDYTCVRGKTYNRDLTAVMMLY